jgi:hypothetical protein
MKSPFPWLALLAFITAALAFTFTDNKYGVQAEKRSVRQALNIVRCSPDWDALDQWLEETDIPPIPGAGNYTWNISSTSDSARFYFNQGINMYYSFHIIEAMASFRKASRFDPSCAIIYWAQALAYGPNINDLGYAASPSALEAVSQANKFVAAASATEKALIRVMNVRYTADSADTNRPLCGCHDAGTSLGSVETGRNSATLDAFDQEGPGTSIRQNTRKPRAESLLYPRDGAFGRSRPGSSEC